MATRTAAYDISQFAPSERRERITYVDNPKRKKSVRAYKAWLVFLCGFLVATMSYTVYSNMLLNDKKSAVASKTDELMQLESEFSYLNYRLESSVSLSNAEQYAVNELGLVKLNPNQIEYVNLRDGNSIIENKYDLENSGFLSGIWMAIVGIFK